MSRPRNSKGAEPPRSLRSWFGDHPVVGVAWVAGLALAASLLAFWISSSSRFLDPGRPELMPDLVAAPEVPVSVVAAPIRIPLLPLAELVDRSVPTRYGDLADRRALEGRSRTEVAFELGRDPFQITLDGDVATVRSTLRYGMRFYYDPPILPEITASCGLEEEEERPRLDVALSAPIALDRDWRLRTRARLDGIVPASDSVSDRCRVTFLNIDVTGSVVGGAREFLEGHLATIDSLVAEVDVREHFRGWWNTLQEPIQLTDSLWLAMRPEAVQTGPVQGFGDSLEIALALQARPTVVYGTRPPLETRSLPPLERGRVSTGLDVRVEARAEYDAASAFLSEQLSGWELNHEGRAVRVDSLSVFGIGAGRLAVELLLSGDVRARLYLVGSPSIDTVTARISVPDLDFDVATQDVVLAAASWLRADELRALLRERASWPAAPAVDWVTEWVRVGLNRDLSDDLRVEGDVEEVRILGAHALREALVIPVAVGGSARLFVTSDGAR